jgi:hypothetical protein
LRAILPAADIIAGPRIRVVAGLAALLAACAVAQGAEPAGSLELRAKGSLPLQYIETATSSTRRDSTSIAPYLDLSATAQLQQNLKASVFVNGGHNELGSFSDGDNTLMSSGVSAERQFGAFSIGGSAEHTHYYTGTFERTANIANDLNVFVRYSWTPNPTLRIRPSLTVSTRFGDDLGMQRTSYSFRVSVEQWLFDKWCFVATTRVRYADYTGIEAGRRDTSVGLSAGLKYAINDNVGVTMLAAVDDRTSNVPSKRADRFAVGASLDFDIDFARPRWPGGR